MSMVVELSHEVINNDKSCDDEMVAHDCTPLDALGKHILKKIHGRSTGNQGILLLRGFTKNGDPITNDSAVKSETQADIVTVYDRAEFERAWIQHSRGTVYVVQP